MGALYDKDKDGTSTFTIDWSDHVDLFGSPTDAILSSLWTVPDGLTEIGDGYSAEQTTITVSGGTSGQVYRLLNQITTENGRVYQDTILVRIVDYAVGSPQPQASSLNVETGTGSATSNSYISVEDADAYHALRRNSAWAAKTLAEKEACLIKASEYLVAKYRMKWRGIRVNREQALDWPRAGVVTEDFYNPQTDPRPALYPDLAFEIPEDEIPREVRDATCEIALRIAAGTDPLPDVTGGGDIKKLKADTVEIEYFGAGQAQAEVAIAFPYVERLLQPLLKFGNRVIRG
jgi:hypothetical protein